MQEEKSKYNLSWYKWPVDQVKGFKESLNNEQMGELFFAVMETVETGNKVEVSAELKVVYSMLCIDVERTRAAYKNKCENLAKNGSKGGKAKAENKANAKNETSFKPPTKTYFKNMMKKIAHDYEMKYFDNLAEDVYKSLCEAGWKVFDNPISTNTQIEAYCLSLLARENGDDILFSCGTNLLKIDSDVDVDMVYDFYLDFDENRGIWNIHGTTYREVKEAAKAFSDNYGKI